MERAAPLSRAALLNTPVVLPFFSLEPATLLFFFFFFCVRTTFMRRAALGLPMSLLTLLTRKTSDDEDWQGLTLSSSS
jgi:hypothetical protein